MDKFKIDTSSLGGRGFFARETVSAGQLILNEQPLLELPSEGQHGEIVEQIFTSIQSLPKVSQTAIRILAQENDKRITSVTTDMLMDRLFRDRDSQLRQSVLDAVCRSLHPFREAITEPTTRRLFRMLRLVNHGCMANAELHWDAEAKAMVLHATSKIDAGEEILVSYIDQFASRKQRHADLGFECECNLCSFPEGEIEEQMVGMGKTLRSIAEFRRQYVGDEMVVPTAAQARAIANDPLVGILEQEAMRVREIAEGQDKIVSSRLAEAYEVLYIIITSRGISGDEPGADQAAFVSKMREHSLLQRCLGRGLPRLVALRQQIEAIAEGDAWKQGQLAAL